MFDFSLTLCAIQCGKLIVSRQTGGFRTIVLGRRQINPTDSRSNLLRRVLINPNSMSKTWPMFALERITDSNQTSLQGPKSANSGSDQLVVRAVPTYTSYRNENPPPSSTAKSEKLANNNSSPTLSCHRRGAQRAAAVFAISASISLLKPATPTAPTTAPFTRIGMPPRIPGRRQ